MIEWIKGHETVILWMTVTSIITFIATLIAVPWLVVRIPSDYFSHKRRSRKLWGGQNLLLRLVFLTIKNLFGYILIITGVFMLAIPGQGMLTTLIGIILIDLPGKYRFERWFVGRPLVLQSINLLRRHAKRDPLVL
jgi:hypothetical protein